MLTKLFSSRTRVDLLTLFLSRADRRLYVREIERMLNRDVRAVQRELRNLEDIGLLTSEEAGNRKYYRVNEDWHLYTELKNMVFKTTGVRGALQEAIADFQGIELAFIYGSYAKGSEGKESDIDVIIIGTPDMDKLNDSVSDLEEKLAREISYTVFDKGEFDKRKKEKDPFLAEVLKGKKIMLKGVEDEL